MPLNIFGEKSPSSKQKKEIEEIKSAVSTPLKLPKSHSKRDAKKKGFKAQDLIEMVEFDEKKALDDEKRALERESKTKPNVASESGDKTPDSEKVFLMDSPYVKYKLCPKCNHKVKKYKVKRHKNMFSQRMKCRNKDCDFEVNYEISVI